MRIIVPRAWATADYLSGNIAEPDAGEVAYNPANSYALGDQAFDATTHRRYRSLVAANLGNPLTDATKWEWVGSTNRWGMLDATVGTSSARATPITITLKFGMSTTVALLGLVGVSQVTLTHKTAGGASTIETRVLLVDEVFSPVDWYDYFFTDPQYRDTLTADNFAPVTDSEITISAASGSGSVSVGSTIVGAPFELGAQKYGITAGYTDYSTVERSASTGLTTIKAGPLVKNQRGQIVVPNGATDSVLQRLRLAQGQPIFVQGDGGYNALSIFGVLGRVELAYTTPALSYISYEIQELT